MAIRISDKFLAPSRGSVDDVLAFFETNPPARRNDSEAIVRRVYALCVAAGMDFSLAMSRIADETGSLSGPSFFVSDIYRERLNIGGLGVTDGGDEGISFNIPEQAADAYMAHLFTYVLGDRYDVLDVTRDDDPRFAATPRAWRGSVVTLDDLRGKWFTNPQGAINSAARGNRIFPSLPDQGTATGTTTARPSGSVTLTIDRRITTRDMGILASREAWITIHNNGNLNSDRFDEAAFVQSGGGDSSVLYHGAIDAGGVCQIEKFDHRGIHAGNATGNATSIAFEMCEGSEPWARVKENTALLLAAIVLGDPRLNFGTFGPENFSLDRIREHRDWPGANPNCPRRLIQTDGGVEKIVARARAIVRDITGTPTPTTTPRPTPTPTTTTTPPPAWPIPTPPDVAAMPYRDPKGNIWLPFRGSTARYTAVRATALRQWAAPDAPMVGFPLRRGEQIVAVALAITVGAGHWLVTADGARLRLVDFVPDREG